MNIWLSSTAVVWKKITEFWSTTISRIIASQTVASLKSRVDSAPIPAARKADIRPKISVLQNQVRKLQKKIAEENVQKAVKVATEAAEVAASNGKVFYISHVNVGLDAAAVQKVLEKVITVHFTDSFWVCQAVL